MKKISIVIVSALTFVLTAFLVGCQNPASVSGGNSTAENIPPSLEDDFISFGANYDFNTGLDTSLYFFDSSENCYVYEFLLDFHNVYPDEFELVLPENANNLSIRQAILTVWSGNYQPTYERSEYSLVLKLNSNPTEITTLRCGLKNKTHNYEYSRMGLTIRIRPVQN